MARVFQVLQPEGTQYLDAPAGARWYGTVGTGQVGPLDALKLPEPIAERWEAMPVEIKVEERPEHRRHIRKLYPSDVMKVGRVAALTSRAREVAEPLVDGYVEWLPTTTSDIWIMHITHVIDALDHERLEVDHNEDGSIGMIWQYAFRRDAIGDAPVFRDRAHLSSNCFTDTLVVALSQLTRVGFELIWDGDEPPFRLPLF